MQVSQLWNKHNRGKKVGVNELKEMISYHLQIALTEEETTVLVNMIRDKYKLSDLDEYQFGNLFKDSNFVRNDKLAV